MWQTLPPFELLGPLRPKLFSEYSFFILLSQPSKCFTLSVYSLVDFFLIVEGMLLQLLEKENMLKEKVLFIRFAGET